MDTQRIIATIYEMKDTHSTEASDLFKQVGKGVLRGDVDGASHAAIRASQSQAKVDVLEELLNKIEYEE